MSPISDLEDNEAAPLRGAAFVYSDTDDEGEQASHLLRYQSASESSPQSSQIHLPLPVWMREASESTILRRIPRPIRKRARDLLDWIEGPEPPMKLSITPVLASIQEAPIRLLDRYLPKRKQRLVLLLVAHLCWFLTWSLTLKASASMGEISGYGAPNSIWCGATYWSRGNDCGLNGNDCRPFANASFPFRCSADCASLQVLNPRAVGDQRIVYKPFVIGGPSPNGDAKSAVYRGDSFICQSAIHAGVITNSQGGCGVVELAGSHSFYPSSQRNGIKSTEFDATFPKSFRFRTDIQSSCSKDLRWPLFGISLVYTSIFSIFTESPAVFFFSIFTILFFHVGLVSDPPNYPDLGSIASLIIGRYLPAAFVAFVIYRYCVYRTLKNLTAQFEKTILWLGGAWVGALSNYTFSWIPIQRLTPHDLSAQPGAWLALIVIVVVVVAIAIGQIHYLRLDGRLPKYLLLYGLICCVLMICVAIPFLNLRIHHYVLALLLLPGTAMQTRPALFYQGLLVGLFINGIARWGFASILETTFALLGDEVHRQRAPLPNITVLATTASTLSVKWSIPPWPYDGVSVLINDVERWRGYTQEPEDKDVFFGNEGWAHQRRVNGEKEYLRFGYMKGSKASAYTKAAIWHGNGTWTPMEKGRLFLADVDA